MSERHDKLNRFWAVEIIPFNKKWKQGDHNIYTNVNINMRANVSHRSHSEGRWTLYSSYQKTRKVRCPLITRSASSQGECSSFSVVFERKIRAPYTSIEFMFDFESWDHVALGDIGVEVVTGNKGYGQFEIAYTILFTAASVIALVLYIWNIRNHIKLRTLTYEQTFIFVLGVGVIFYDNPFFILEYVCGSITTFNVMDTLFKNAFIMLVLAFWLLMSERFASAKAEKRMKGNFLDLSSFSHVAKLILVLVYFVLSFITTTWTSVRERNDPINGSSISYPGVLTFYIFTVVIIVGVIGWVLWMTIRSIPYVTSSQEVFTRFCFYAIPSFVVALSLFIGSISGSFGGITRSSKYYFFIINIYF